MLHNLIICSVLKRYKHAFLSLYNGHHYPLFFNSVINTSLIHISKPLFIINATCNRVSFDQKYLYLSLNHI